MDDTRNARTVAKSSVAYSFMPGYHHAEVIQSEIQLGRCTNHTADRLHALRPKNTHVPAREHAARPAVIVKDGRRVCGYSFFLRDCSEVVDIQIQLHRYAVSHVNCVFCPIPECRVLHTGSHGTPCVKFDGAIGYLLRHNVTVCVTGVRFHSGIPSSHRAQLGYGSPNIHLSVPCSEIFLLPVLKRRC